MICIKLLYFLPAFISVFMWFVTNRRTAFDWSFPDHLSVSVLKLCAKQMTGHLLSDVLVTAVSRIKPLIYLTICSRFCTADSTLSFMVCGEHEEKKPYRRAGLLKERLQTFDLETERTCYRADCVIVLLFFFYWINICLSITFPLSLDR